MKWKLLSLLLWPVQAVFWIIGGVALGLAGMTLADIIGIIVPGQHLISYANEWLAIWSGIAVVFIGLMLAVALLRDRLDERAKPFAIQASWVLGEDSPQGAVPNGSWTLATAARASIQWKGHHWVSIESSFPDRTPVRKANPLKTPKQQNA